MKTLPHNYINLALGNEFQQHNNYLYWYTNQLYVIIITSCQFFVMLRVLLCTGCGWIVRLSFLHAGGVVVFSAKT